MRNLSIAHVNEARFDPGKLPLSATTFDTSTGDVIYTLGPTTSKPIVELRRQSNGSGKFQDDGLITSWDAPCPLPELECDEVLSLHYFHESSSICIVLAGGDLVLVREKPLPDQERIEIVGSIDVGLIAAQWSWNASLLALVTRTGSLVLMSQQLEPVIETAFNENDLSMSKHVSVGWGKKETQFQGKRAKAMKDPTMPDSIDEGKPSPNEDGKTTISWRGDGAFVAVNSMLSTSRRVIRVYSADGVLDSVSEPVDGLETAMSWRPYGNLIASIRRSPEKLEVLFFERNGLRHGQFELRLNADEMSSLGSRISLDWNCDSSILAVKLSDRVCFWTMGNYHYYLKQEIRLDDLREVDWHPTDPLLLNLSNKNTLRSVSMDSQVLRGSISTPFDYGLVAVIDGKILKLTPLKHVNSPPPMAFIEITAEDNIVSCTVSRTCQRIAFLTHDHIYLCKLEMRPATRNADDPSIRHSGKVHLKKLKLPAKARQCQQIVMQNDDKIYLVSSARGTPTPQQSEYPSAICYQSTWVDTNHDQEELRIFDAPIFPSAQQLLTDQAGEKVYVRTGDAVYPLLKNSLKVSSEASSICEIFHLVVDGETRAYTVSLLKPQQMVINGQDDNLTIDNVTSFVVTDAHIIYTTSNHLLKFIHLTNPSSMSVSDDTPELDERCRAVERGSIIVTAIPSTYAVVLQMPRGNLETIYPRIMVLSGIRSHIHNREYKKAFLACQIHQVDLNILYDYDAKLFLTNVPLFIDQLKKPSRVDEFIQKLKEEDVTKTLYRDTSNSTTTQTTGIPQASPDKINTICNSLITELQSRPATYQPNIITANVCKRPPDLISALSLVSDLRQSSSEEADLAIAHLCFLTDTNRLYDTALGLYDLELTLLVAQNAQRDPREYMPFLQSLQDLPVLRRQYTIDNHLKRFAKALVSLHAMGEHDEVEAFTIKHNLYTDTISLYKHSSSHRDKIKKLYADHLADNSKHAHAATLYESLHDYEAAYPLYALAHQWREALTCACLVPVPAVQLESLAKSLAATCAEESRDYRSAATILVEYMNDALGAAELLCKGSYFAEATRILTHPDHSKRQDFIPAEQLPQIVDSALTRKFGEILELIADCQTQLSSQVPRIEELRIKKAEDPFAFFGGEANVGDGIDIPDNISLAATDASTLGGQSMFTRYAGGAGGSQVSTKFGGTVRSDVSRKTSKTKRKEERKRAQGKKGSVYEEEYLVASCGRLIERVNGVHDEVHRLVSGLSRRGLSEQAVKVEEVMQGIQSGCEDARRRVWNEVKEVNIVNGDSGVNGYKPSGADAVLLDSQAETQGAGEKKAPEVKAWKSDVV